MIKPRILINKLLNDLIFPIVIKKPITISLGLTIIGYLLFLFLPVFDKKVGLHHGWLLTNSFKTDYNHKDSIYLEGIYKRLLESTAKSDNNRVGIVNSELIYGGFDVFQFYDNSLIYAIHKPPKSTSYSSLLITTNLDNCYSVGLLISTFRRLIKLNIMAHDIILIISNNQTNINRFFNDKIDIIKNKKIKRFREADAYVSFNLDISQNTNSVNIDFVDKKLPNSDVVSTILVNAKNNNIKVKLSTTESKCYGYLCKIKNVLNQIIGMLNPNQKNNTNTHFVNILGINSSKNNIKTHSNVEFGSFIEGLMKSFNYLHAPLLDVSYNHYIFTNNDTVVSIPFFVAFAATVAVAINIYIMIQITKKTNEDETYYMDITPIVGSVFSLFFVFIVCYLSIIHIMDSNNEILVIENTNSIEAIVNGLVFITCFLSVFLTSKLLDTKRQNLYFGPLMIISMLGAAFCLNNFAICVVLLTFASFLMIVFMIGKITSILISTVILIVISPPIGLNLISIFYLDYENIFIIERFKDKNIFNYILYLAYSILIYSSIASIVPLYKVPGNYKKKKMD